jgi:hypothetical protein
VNKTAKIIAFMKAHPPHYDEHGWLEKVALKFHTSKGYVQGVAWRHNITTPRKIDGKTPDIRAEVFADRRIKALEAEKKKLEAKNRELSKLLDEETELKQKLAATQAISTYEIKPKCSSRTSEAVAVMVASDWHVEEIVQPKHVNNLNIYNPTISKECGEAFFKNGLRLTEIFAKDVKIETIVLALLGDFLSNDIHPELAETNAMLPMVACRYAQDMIASGIEFLLDYSKCNLIIPTAVGNHSRTTPDIRHATEQGHSLEFYMYHNLATYFRDEKRVQFLIAEGYHSFLDIFGVTIRFHHGHQIRYQGGVGGIYIPVHKAINQWNKAKHADCDVFGHWHMLRDGGNFVSNGSMIGWNPYAISIKADYEPPRQAYFLVDKHRGRTINAPILFPERRT